MRGWKECDGKDGRNIVFSKNLGLEAFVSFLRAMEWQGQQFKLFDPKYPSPSDPGAYLSYSPQNSRWRMTLGNHGWSGGIYTVERSTIAQQLYDLYTGGLLEALQLEHVHFASHYKPESHERNAEINELLKTIHARPQVVSR